MKRALVINPWACDFKLYDEWMHPLGLYFLVSLLRHNRWDVRFVNCLSRDASSRVKRHGTAAFPQQQRERPQLFAHIHRRYKRYGIADEALANAILQAPSPDIVFIGSAMTYWIDGLQETVDAVQALLPGVPLIIGGVSAMLMPGLIAARFGQARVFAHGVIDNPHELARLHPLLADLSSQGWQPSLLQAFQTFDHLPHGPLLLSLGCPLRCSYCASARLQPAARLREIELVAAETRYLVERFGVTDLAFADDALLYRPRQRLLPFLAHLRRSGPTLRLHTPNGLHLRWLSPALAQAMVAAGFTTVRFGYESGLPDHHAHTGAKAHRHQIEPAVRLLQEAGMNPAGIGIYVMAGLPGQTPETVAEEMRFIAGHGVKVKPVFLSPVPQTPLFEHYRRQYPAIATDPRQHNDTFFVTQLPGWSWQALDEVMTLARRLNVRT